MIRQTSLCSLAQENLTRSPASVSSLMETLPNLPLMRCKEKLTTTSTKNFCSSQRWDIMVYGCEDLNIVIFWQLCRKLAWGWSQHIKEVHHRAFQRNEAERSQTNWRWSQLESLTHFTDKETKRELSGQNQFLKYARFSPWNVYL